MTIECGYAIITIMKITERKRGMIEGKVRLKFHKIGRLKYISHLDLNRTMKGALGRARVPVKYTEGFNPHPKMVFSLPLPVGAESVCEYLDFVLTSPCDAEDLKKRINAQLTDELKIVEIYPQEMPFQEIALAEYDFCFYDLSEDDLNRALDGELPIEKKSKKGMVTVDLSTKIAGYTVEKIEKVEKVEKVENAEKEEGFVRLHALLGAGSDDFVNPELLVRAIARALEKPVEDYTIMRLEIFTEDHRTFR